MEKIKNNPVLMGVLSCVGCAVLMVVIYLVMSKIKNRTLAEQFSDPLRIFVLVVGSVGGGLTSYRKAKENLEKKEKEKK